MEPAAINTGDWVGPEKTGEQRESPRFALLMRAAKLISAQGEFVCVLRDASEKGVRLRAFHRLPAGQRMALEMGSGKRYEIERIWDREREAGFQFCDAVELEKLVNDMGRYPRRQLRLQLEMPVVLTARGEASNATLLNISQQGARIESARFLATDQLLHLQGANLPVVSAKVRWRRGEEYGVVFEDTFSMRELACLAAALQCPALGAEADCQQVVASLRHRAGTLG